ncbi:Pectin acetylesterase 9 [Zea mays]|uniref:Pectin acetylesterase 9 n=1 Tax=Zea mays TaxID=4577 RepID=A0A1D6NMF8_MAIZE|nr:Pectin acetylesterase 9 [Zea mays]
MLHPLFVSSHHNISNLTMFFILSTDSYLTTCILYRDIHLSFCQFLIGLKCSLL